MTSKWARWLLKSPPSRLFTQAFIQAQIKENNKALHHWPLRGKIHQWLVTGKMFPFDDVILEWLDELIGWVNVNTVLASQFENVPLPFKNASFNDEEYFKHHIHNWVRAKGWFVYSSPLTYVCFLAIKRSTQDILDQQFNCAHWHVCFLAINETCKTFLTNSSTVPIDICLLPGHKRNMQDILDQQFNCAHWLMSAS